MAMRTFFKSIERLYLVAIIVRLLLIVYGEWQDRNFQVKYTDVDYRVFTDGARLVASNNSSPYLRATYRYPPILAWVLIPNVILTPTFGKVIFALADVYAGKLIERLLRLRGGLAENDIIFWTASFLLNPLCVNISTRGNADPFVCVIILAVLFNLMQKRLVLSAVLFGFAVHFRLFPILMGPSIVLFLNDNYIASKNSSAVDDKSKHSVNDGQSCSSARPWYRQAFKERLYFTLISASIFLLLGMLMYWLYGWPFLHESYLYHVTRSDNRHNFSVYFYSLYLYFGKPIGLLTSLGSFVPMIILQACIAASMHRDIILCFCIQILAFVAFNKVCTAQYFDWYAVLLPIAIPSLRKEIGVRKGTMMVTLWIATELFWLYYGYQLEMLGNNVFLSLWFAGLLFFLTNMLIIGQLVFHSRPVRPLIDSSGRLTPLKVRE